MSAAEPDDHLAGLIHGLSNLGLRLARVGRDDEVLAPTMEAVELLDQNPPLGPGNDVESLAESLAWLGWWLRRHGHRKEARAATRAAKELRRKTDA
ncbi:hypothetical protein [Streptomyces sp. HUAS TT7]|uniref:hypothetical protein n=1 Tax=Streptomyces sp. HUAS TT7 TaxID=3447507 RepID=UPI003F660892